MPSSDRSNATDQAPETAGAPTADSEDSDATEDALGAGNDEPSQSSFAASTYAGLPRGECESELERRSIAFRSVTEARGVIAPVRLDGPLFGIAFHSMLPASSRSQSPYEIYDCRLVLALDDWARILAKYNITEVVHYSVYRPPPASQVLRGPGKRHSGALAIDVGWFRTADGERISVEKDFHGRIGAKPCAAASLSATTRPVALLLRQVVCEAAASRLFHVLLTPDYNRPHRNHFHLEVAAGARWVMVR